MKVDFNITLANFGYFADMALALNAQKKIHKLNYIRF